MANPNQVTLVSGAIPAAGTYDTDGYYTGRFPAGAKYIVVQTNFVYGAGGTTIDVFLQTSLDGGATWCDIAQFALVQTSVRKVSAVKVSTALAANTTPTNGALADNTILSGLIGNLLRVHYVVAGTYTGAAGSLRVDVVLR
jgi:hypothetical protein